VSLADRWPLPDHHAVRDALLAAWDRPGYHDLRHLEEVLDRLDVLAAAGVAFDATSVGLAAWFHDAVYDPERADNEERSARLAARMLADTDLPAATVDEVVRLVELTVTHAPEPGDRNGRVLCDADLAILGADPDRYAAYAAAVREEYGFVPEDLFRAGRAEVLSSLLALPHLFHTDTARERYEENARRNIETELMLLNA
jgi:predicted metal-dependent HD superfamily phosphohydrolase